MKENNRKSLGFHTIFTRSDMMGFVPNEDKDMIAAVQAKGILNDSEVTHLRSRFHDRNIDLVIRCHLLNNREAYLGKQPVPTDFLEWFGGLDQPRSMEISIETNHESGLGNING